MYLQLAVSSMFEPFFVLEGVGLLDSRDAIRRHGAEGSLNTERVWVVLAGSSSILSKRQNVPISHIVERAVPISHKRKIPVPLNHNPPAAAAAREPPSNLSRHGSSYYSSGRPATVSVNPIQHCSHEY